ncbi:hypothetical protein [Rubrivirga marina]|uniref:Uncharacterized protein n=1 Tax=Rubrivirga marina TaxID=1196024 RepID=A0A271IWR1_9BACT|nr:hypothetical protein [Rubrivirga marina]PAP75653.1 hypothetical protein BSZ37_03990 [Rubrivirga marina]
MEPTAPSEAEPGRPDPRPEWRSLSHLRDRVDAAVREIERLRSENAALAKRLLEIQETGAGGSSPSFAFGEGEDPAALKARVQGFLDLVDGLLQAGEGAGGDGSADPPPAA